MSFLLHGVSNPDTPDAVIRFVENGEWYEDNKEHVNSNLWGRDSNNVISSKGTENYITIHESDIRAVSASGEFECTFEYFMSNINSPIRNVEFEFEFENKNVGKFGIRGTDGLSYIEGVEDYGEISGALKQLNLTSGDKMCTRIVVKNKKMTIFSGKMFHPLRQKVISTESHFKRITFLPTAPLISVQSIRCFGSPHDEFEVKSVNKEGVVIETSYASVNKPFEKLILKDCISILVAVSPHLISKEAMNCFGDYIREFLT